MSGASRKSTADQHGLEVARRLEYVERHFAHGAVVNHDAQRALSFDARDAVGRTTRFRFVPCVTVSPSRREGSRRASTFVDAIFVAPARNVGSAAL